MDAATAVAANNAAAASTAGQPIDGVPLPMSTRAQAMAASHSARPSSAPPAGPSERDAQQPHDSPLRMAVTTTATKQLNNTALPSDAAAAADPGGVSTAARDPALQRSNQPGQRHGRHSPEPSHGRGTSLCSAAPNWTG